MAGQHEQSEVLAVDDVVSLLLDDFELEQNKNKQLSI